MPKGRVVLKNVGHQNQTFNNDIISSMAFYYFKYIKGVTD